MTPEGRKLLLEIARCPVMIGALTGQPSPCEKVVLCQCPGLDNSDRERVWERKHHIPEPWVGDLEQAPLLFLSSNPFGNHLYDASPATLPREELSALDGKTLGEHPSLGRPFEAPKAEWDDDQIVDKFESMFDVWTDPTGTRARTDEAGGLGPAVPYWKAAHAFASSVFAETPRPGSDYALTEIVRCRSPEELGVDEAGAECVPRYLEKTLALSPAPVVVVFGRRARQAIRTMTGYADYGPVSPILTVAGRERTLVFLAHPNSRRSKYPKVLRSDDLDTVRSRLRAS